jgi:hypothetical protein
VLGCRGLGIPSSQPWPPDEPPKGAKLVTLFEDVINGVIIRAGASVAELREYCARRIVPLPPLTIE